MTCAEAISAVCSGISRPTNCSSSAPSRASPAARPAPPAVASVWASSSPHSSTRMVAARHRDHIQSPDLSDERPNLACRVATLDRVELAGVHTSRHKPSAGLIPHPWPSQLRLAPRLRLLDRFVGQRSDAQTLLAWIGRLEHEGMVLGAVRASWLRGLLTAIAAPLAVGCSRHTVSPRPIRRRDARVAPRRIARPPRQPLPARAALRDDPAGGLRKPVQEPTTAPAGAGSTPTRPARPFAPRQASPGAPAVALVAVAGSGREALSERRSAARPVG